MDKNILISGNGVFGIVRVKNGYIVEVDEGEGYGSGSLSWMVGKAWRSVYCWNRIKSFTVG